MQKSTVAKSCMHFRILKMIATSGFLAALECTKFVFLQCFPKPIWFKSALLLRTEKGRVGGRKVGTPLHQFLLLREEKRREGEKGRGGKESRNAPPSIPASKRRKG